MSDTAQPGEPRQVEVDGALFGSPVDPQVQAGPSVIAASRRVTRDEVGWERLVQHRLLSRGWFRGDRDPAVAQRGSAFRVVGPRIGVGDGRPITGRRSTRVEDEAGLTCDDADCRTGCFDENDEFPSVV